MEVWRCIMAIIVGITTVNALQAKGRQPQEQPPYCSMPPDRGPCRANVSFWFYQKKYGECKMFNYGGCGGNNNRFWSEKKCYGWCSPEKRRLVCSVYPDPKPCKSLRNWWFFNPASDSCVQLPHGWCPSSANRFPRCEKCMRRCSLTDARETCRREYKRMEEEKRAVKAGQIPTISWELPGSAEIPQGLLMPELGLGAPTLSLEGAMKVMKGGISSEAGQPSGLPQLPALPETSPVQGKLKEATSGINGLNDGPQEEKRGFKEGVPSSLEAPPSLKATETAAAVVKGVQASQPLGELVREPGKQSVQNEIGGPAPVKAPPGAQVSPSNPQETIDKKGAPPQISRAYGKEVVEHQPGRRQQGAENSHHHHVILIALIKSPTMAPLPEEFDQQIEGNDELGEVPNGGPSSNVDLPKAAIK